MIAIGLILLIALNWGHGAYILAKAHLAQILIASSWRKSIESGENETPWPWADTWPVYKLTMAGETDYVLNGTDGSALAFGPGLMHQSAQLGSGTVVIAAHRDTHFKTLGELKFGDLLQLQSKAGHHYLFEVKSIDIVDSRDQQLIMDHSKNQLKLITCYPFDAIIPGGPLRYEITADLTPFL
jgi:sortase A